MKQHRSILTITLLVTVLSLLLTSATKAREPKLPKPNDRWIQVETANFTLFSNAPEKMTKKAGANLEQLRAVLATLFGGMRFSSPVPTYIFVFDDSKSFAPYGTFYQGKVKEVGGYFGAGRLAKLHAYRDFQKHYNEAVDLVNRGDFEDAIAILEPLVTSSPTPQLTAMAERLLNDLKKKP
jgi:hypothetical protein